MFKLIKKHYHWVIAFLAFLEMIIFGGLLNSANVFIIPITEELQVTRAGFSMATIPYTLVSCVGTMLSGYLFHKFGYKKCAIVSLIVVAASYVLTACADSLTVYMVSKIMMGMGYATCFTAGAVRIVKSWFFKHQGLVVSLISMASGLGGSLMTVVLTNIVEGQGWRKANLACAVTLASIAVLYLLVKDRPEEMGLRPFGFGELPKKKQKVTQNIHDWPGLSFSEILRKPSFYLMAFCTLGSCVCIYITSSVLVAHFQAQGFTAQESASLQSMLMLVLAGAKVICGALSDKIGPKPVTVGCMVCAVVGQYMLGCTADPVLCHIATCILAIGLCMTALMAPLLTAPLFGYRSYITINGIFMAMCSLASIFSGPISNNCFDRTGSYTSAFRVAAVVNGGVLVLYLLLFLLCEKDRRRYFETHPEES